MGWLDDTFGGVLGSAVGSVFSGAMNKRSADKQMRFQDEQSRTQYQRAVADMKAAGLNPMLSAKLGGNAAMQGASASMPDLGQTINTSKQVSNQKKLIEAQIGLIRSQADQASANASLARTQASDVVASQQAGRWSADVESKLSGAAQSRAMVNQIEANVKKVLAELPGVNADSLMKQLSVPEQEALNWIYTAHDGDVGKVLKTFKVLKEGGAGIDTIVNALGIGGLLNKIGKKVPTKKITHSRTNTPKGASETYSTTWSE